MVLYSAKICAGTCDIAAMLKMNTRHLFIYLFIYVLSVYIFSVCLCIYVFIKASSFTQFMELFADYHQVEHSVLQGYDTSSMCNRTLTFTGT
jgi:hypothetical protein